MYKHHKISVIMPCRNEGGHLEEVVKRIPKFVDEIIIVSNCSTDDTVAVGRRLGLSVYEDNRTIQGIGYGYAHITGINAATGGIIAGIDGDATYPIEKLGAIISYLLEHKLDFISCNRYPLQDGTNIPLKLRLGVSLLNLEARLLYGVKVKDILSGMWVFRKEAKPLLSLTMGDWNLSPQIKISAATNSAIRFGEYSIAQYQRKGTSKQRYFKTGMSHLSWLLRNWLELKTPVKRLVNKHNMYIYRFVAVGVVGFVFNSAILVGLTSYAGLGKVPGEVVAMLLALQLTFTLHDKWTYAVHNRAGGDGYTMRFTKRYSTYLVSNSFGSILTIVLFGIFVHFLSKLPALAIAAVISMVWNFLLNKFIVWRTPAAELSESP